MFNIAILASLAVFTLPSTLADQIPFLASPSPDPLLTPSRLPKPTRPLPWSTLNVLSTTDTHGWLRGHTHKDHIPESLYSADIADLAAFKEHLTSIADSNGQDLIFVDSGDTVDGNGFVDADTSGVKGRMARRLLAQAGWDITTVGNHEVSNPSERYLR